ncbi:unnamed protein product [marine sediment metagenome]|uniref:Uncharacterized protein n=1 Tax=marine sediment metagenome TaxID=412755 RepID=X0ZYU0_9ZZZZ
MDKMQSMPQTDLPKLSHDNSNCPDGGNSMNPLISIGIGLILTAVGVIGLLVAFKQDRYHKRGPIPEEGDISAIQFLRLPLDEPEPEVLPTGYLRNLGLEELRGNPDAAKN